MRAITPGPLPACPTVSYTLFLPVSDHPFSCPFVAPALEMSTLLDLSSPWKNVHINHVFCQGAQTPSPGLWVLAWEPGKSNSLGQGFLVIVFL